MLLRMLLILRLLMPIFWNATPLPERIENITISTISLFVHHYPQRTIPEARMFLPLLQTPLPPSHTGMSVHLGQKCGVVYGGSEGPVFPPSLPPPTEFH